MNKHTFCGFLSGIPPILFQNCILIIIITYAMSIMLRPVSKPCRCFRLISYAVLMLQFHRLLYNPINIQINLVGTILIANYIFSQVAECTYKHFTQSYPIITIYFKSYHYPSHITYKFIKRLKLKDYQYNHFGNLFASLYESSCAL